MLHWSCDSSLVSFLFCHYLLSLSIPVLFSVFHFRPFQNCMDIFTIVWVFLTFSTASSFCSRQEVNCHLAVYKIQKFYGIKLDFVMLTITSVTYLHLNFSLISYTYFYPNLLFHILFLAFPKTFKPMFYLEIFHFIFFSLKSLQNLTWLIFILF